MQSGSLASQEGSRFGEAGKPGARSVRRHALLGKMTLSGSESVAFEDDRVAEGEDAIAEHAADHARAS